MRDDPRADWKGGLWDALWIASAALLMGSFVAIAHLQAFGPLLILGVGETIMFVSLGAGILLGILLAKDYVHVVMGKAFVAFLGAFLFVALTVFAPVLVGVVPDQTLLQEADVARSSLVTVILVFPLILFGSVFGRLLGELFKGLERRPIRRPVTKE
ncbi:MAG: hypothetical protein ACE5JE_00525 [Thermoplasmata archaeon]